MFREVDDGVFFVFVCVCMLHTRKTFYVVWKLIIILLRAAAAIIERMMAMDDGGERRRRETIYTSIHSKYIQQKLMLQSKSNVEIDSPFDSSIIQNVHI